MLRLQITVTRARRLFPGTPPGLFYRAAPHDGRGRFLSLGQAFQIARAFHWPRREAAKSARRSAFTSARFRAERAGWLPGAVDHVAVVVADELASLEALAVDLGGKDEAARLRAAASGIAHQAARARARLAAQLEKLGAAAHGK
ncbi:hypothetical protein D2N39_13060 [Gemmobacter lutimaris]|uniref:Uncharacterized protein n=1 Tax=Gemmobacter lutimaris TaxID=2306023 RepID=A0A398BUS5_9RHOB|nr:hypothetical protein D2N39_13060 [Gemmobacter lutimaris]